jgi:hypothetical protein
MAYIVFLNPDAANGITLYDFAGIVIENLAPNPQFAPFFDEATLFQLREARDAIDAGRVFLVGGEYSRLTLDTTLTEESEATFDFIESIRMELREVLSGEFFIVGGLAVAYEMHESFPGELALITMLTAISVYVTVAIAFKSLVIPLILVSVIQCAIFLTMGSTYFQGMSIIYLALLIVQCLLKAATIDYAILYTAHYTERRKTEAKKKAVVSALNNSIHTILTSGLISGTITLLVGVMYVNINAAISEILLLVARGCFIAMALVVLVLPSLLLVFDRLICKEGQQSQADASS